MTIFSKNITNKSCYKWICCPCRVVTCATQVLSRQLVSLIRLLNGTRNEIECRGFYSDPLLSQSCCFSVKTVALGTILGSIASFFGFPQIPLFLCGLALVSILTDLYRTSFCLELSGSWERRLSCGFLCKESLKNCFNFSQESLQHYVEGFSFLLSLQGLCFSLVGSCLGLAMFHGNAFFLLCVLFVWLYCLFFQKALERYFALSNFQRVMAMLSRDIGTPDPIDEVCQKFLNSCSVELKQLCSSKDSCLSLFEKVKEQLKCLRTHLKDLNLSGVLASALIISKSPEEWRSLMREGVMLRIMLQRIEDLFTDLDADLALVESRGLIPRNFCGDMPSWNLFLLDRCMLAISCDHKAQKISHLVIHCFNVANLIFPGCVSEEIYRDVLLYL
ncbi:hypothetical protein [Candidatus Similichlamydia laticola]|uniref:Uncharacterized protein n=1 Tax=Candidatus Similichlamydia laticola TaxID=2170265 RepID=A0A369KHV4_9BACT|nr:hypothetical protein [Candidatus Similichlamydia laticola]RDB31373.1 hypothetical protein HAT2_00522 [Candidatus Similichlamydia laticola]